MVLGASPILEDINSEVSSHACSGRTFIIPPNFALEMLGGALLKAYVHKAETQFTYTQGSGCCKDLRQYS